MSTPAPHNTSPQNTNNALAIRLRTLHKPGHPLLLTNSWDAISATSISSARGTKALATASAAVASAAGLTDDELDLSTNLAAIRAVAKVAKAHNLPLTADFQDGYAEKLEEGVRELIRMGVVGINLEDFGRGKGGLYAVDEAQERIRNVMRVAAEEDVPDFVVNARTDALLLHRPLSEAIARGKAYLEAGAFNVFIWGGRERGGMSRDEVEEACRELDGRLNVSLKVVEKGLSARELAEIGVARISVGPQIMMKAREAIKEEVERILETGSA